MKTKKDLLKTRKEMKWYDWYFS